MNDVDISELMKLEPPVLDLKLKELMVEQAQRKWIYEHRGSEQQKLTEPEFASWVQGRVKMGIAISSILRRTNTGPAKAPKRGKAAPDLSAISEDMLS